MKKVYNNFENVLRDKIGKLLAFKRELSMPKG
jgi:hypothetical protein